MKLLKVEDIVICDCGDNGNDGGIDKLLTVMNKRISVAIIENDANEGIHELRVLNKSIVSN